MIQTMLILVLSACQLAPQAPPAPQTAGPTAGPTARSLPLPMSPTEPEIVLPPLLVAGKWATLAVVGGDGRLLPGAAVELSDDRTVRTDETGRATFLAATQPSLFTAVLADTARADASPIQASAPVVADPAEQDPLMPFHVDRVPLTFGLNELVPVLGVGFGGRADQNRVWLENEPALVLASSPMAMVFAALPKTPRGPSPIILQTGDHRFHAGQATVVELSLSAYADTLKAGQKSYVYVIVRGTDESVGIVVHNLNPETAQLIGGNEQFLQTMGGPTNSAAVEVVAQASPTRAGASGEFRLAAWVVPPPSATPLATRLRQLLLAARSHADPELVHRLGRLLVRLEKEPQRPEKIRRELARMARDAVTSPKLHPEVRAYLDAALVVLTGEQGH